MQYHAPTGQFTLGEPDLKRASMYLRDAIKQIRITAGLPLTAHKHAGPMGSPQFAEKSLLDAAQALGMDLGARREGQLDVSDGD